MLLLKSLSLLNFLSHKDTTINFNPETRLIIDGKSGSGKSSLIEAVVWTLFGTGRTDNKMLIKKGAKTAEVSLVLVDSEDEKISYKIKRSVSVAGSVNNKHYLEIFELNDKGKFTPIKVSGIRPCQEYIEKNIIKSSYLLFVNSIVSLQQGVDTFISQTAARRKDIIMEMIQAKNYDEYLKRAKEFLSDHKTKLEVINNKIEDRNNQIARDKEKAGNVETYRQTKEKLEKEIKIVEEKIEGLVAEERKINDELLKLTFKEDTKKNLFFLIDGQINSIADLNQKIIKLQTIDIKLLENDAKEYELYKSKLAEEDDKRNSYYLWQEKLNEINKNRPPLRDFENELSLINQQIISILNEPILTCPKCGAKYPQFEENQQLKIRNLEVQISHIEEDKKTSEGREAEYKNKIDLLGGQPDFDRQKIDNLKEKMTGLESSLQKLTEAKNAALTINQYETEIGKLSAEKENNEKKVKDIEQELLGKAKLDQELVRNKSLFSSEKFNLQNLTLTNTQNQSLLVMAEIALDNVERCKKETEELKENKVKVEYDIEALEAVKGAFSPNGIKAIIIDFVIPTIEERINEILSQLSDFRVKLETQKSGLTEGVVIEGLHIVIINDLGQEMAYENYSGGEKVKVNISISEGLASIQKIGFRLWDETIIGFDLETIESFSSVILKLKDNISQLIVISHISEVKELFNERIEIKKVDGTSIINN